MAKRPVLPDNYNPIGDRLKKAIATPVVQLVPEPEKVVDKPQIPEPIKEEVASIKLVEHASIELFNDEPVGKELKESSVRFRCTTIERKKWHSLSFELTGESGRLSHIIRAALLLIENSYEELKRNSSEIQRVRHPAKVDQLGLLLYEQRIAEFLYDAIRGSGRPKW